MTISRRQIALVHVARAQLGMSDESYRDVLRLHAGVDSATDLDAVGFEIVMARFHQLGFTSSWHARNLGDRRGMATAKQVALIRSLWREFSGGDDERALGRWLERSFGVSALRFLDAPSTSKAITALKAMARRKARDVQAAPHCR